VRQSDVNKNSGSASLQTLDVCLPLGISRAKGVEAMDFD